MPAQQYRSNGGVALPLVPPDGRSFALLVVRGASVYVLDPVENRDPVAIETEFVTELQSKLREPLSVKRCAVYASTATVRSDRSIRNDSPQP